MSQMTIDLTEYSRTDPDPGPYPRSNAAVEYRHAAGRNVHTVVATLVRDYGVEILARLGVQHHLTISRARPYWGRGTGVWLDAGRDVSRAEFVSYLAAETGGKVGGYRDLSVTVQRGQRPHGQDYEIPVDDWVITLDKTRVTVDGHAVETAGCPVRLIPDTIG